MTPDTAFDFVTVDADRERRLGLPEVIYAPGKTSEQLAKIAAQLLARNHGAVFASRVDPTQAAEVTGHDPAVRHDPDARLLVWRDGQRLAGPVLSGTVAVVSAGTADLPVAREAAGCARVIGLDVREVHDVGVAGLHRLLDRIEEIRAADVVIVLAGMEAALASVVGGLVAAPVVAVPTSTGYGAALDGVTALLGMLSSCAPGVTVVNIDGGFCAALAAYRLVRTAAPGRTPERGAVPDGGAA